MSAAFSSASSFSGSLTAPALSFTPPHGPSIPSFSETEMDSESDSKPYCLNLRCGTCRYCTCIDENRVESGSCNDLVEQCLFDGSRIDENFDINEVIDVLKFICNQLICPSTIEKCIAELHRKKQHKRV
jgi:hypothetical protein